MISLIEMVEYETKVFPEADFSEELAKVLFQKYRSQIIVEPPSFKNVGEWQLISQGWVGQIPLSEEQCLWIKPKVPILNLFSMLLYAYKLKNFRILDGLVASGPIDEISEYLALILAKLILFRIRQGLYRSYVGMKDDLPYVRGRIDIASQMRNPARIALPCMYEEHTSEVEDNQILLWTVTRMLESGICHEKSQAQVRGAYWALQRFTNSIPCSAATCKGRTYNRLNADYEPMHVLCGFFLERIGASTSSGDRKMIPFLVDMSHLFELFVVEWLKAKIPPSKYKVIAQEKVDFPMGSNVSIHIDISITNADSGLTEVVLDTKYKAPAQSSSADIEQVVAYAVAKDCKRAVLVYPTILPTAISGKWGNEIHVESLTFNLDGNIEDCGREFLGQLNLKNLVPPDLPLVAPEIVPGGINRRADIASTVHKDQEKDD